MSELRGDEGRAAVRGPVERTERALAPDLARGTMLLGIALANAAGVVFAAAPGIEPAPHGLERLANLVLVTAVHARAYPVFAVMFGYGLVQLERRQAAAGASADAIRAVLLRRNLWLVAFGFLHAALLYFGDFLGAYGIDGMIAAVLLLPRSDRVHRVVPWIWGLTLIEVLGLGAMAAVRLAHATGPIVAVPVESIASFAAGSYGAAMRDRLSEWPVHTLTVLPFMMIVWLGIWAGRRRLLEEAERHRRLLVIAAVGGLALAFGGGLPLGFASAGWLHLDAPAMRSAFLLHQVSGMFGGPGFVALFGLLAGPFARRPRAGLRAIAALGQRSLTGYLSQSVAWLVLFAPYTLDLRARFGSPILTAIVAAVVVWLATLAWAVALQRRGSRGPAEVLLRRLTYGRPRTRQGAAAPASAAASRLARERMTAASVPGGGAPGPTDSA